MPMNIKDLFCRQSSDFKKIQKHYFPVVGVLAIANRLDFDLAVISPKISLHRSGKNDREAVQHA